MPKTTGPRTALLVLLLLLLGAATVRARSGPRHPLEELLVGYRTRLREALRADYERFDDLRKAAPRGVVRWRGQQLRFPPPPEMNPDLGTVLDLYALAALPPAWQDPLNRAGADLFTRGAEDGRSREVARAWRHHEDRLRDRELDRESILSLAQIFPGFQPEEDYTRPDIPFEAMQEAGARVWELLEKIPGSRRGSIDIPDGSSAGRDLMMLFERYNEVARRTGLALRRRVHGLAMRSLIELQLHVYAHLQGALGRDPEAKDVRRFPFLMPRTWRKLLEAHHARQYFAGFNAVARRPEGGTGSGTSDEPFEGSGTGTGTGTPLLVIEGGGTGAGEPAEEAVAGGGTGDGTVPSAGTRKTVTGTGEG